MFFFPLEKKNAISKYFVKRLMIVIPSSDIFTAINRFQAQWKKKQKTKKIVTSKKDYFMKTK